MGSFGKANKNATFRYIYKFFPQPKLSRPYFVVTVWFLVTPCHHCDDVYLALSRAVAGGCYEHWCDRWQCVTAMNSRPEPEPRVGRWLAWCGAGLWTLARGGPTVTATLDMGREEGHDAMTSWHTWHTLMGTTQTAMTRKPSRQTGSFFFFTRRPLESLESLCAEVREM